MNFIRRSEWTSTEVKFSVRMRAQGAVIHHSATPNRDILKGDDEKQAALKVLHGIYLHHTGSNGWTDVGLSLLHQSRRTDCGSPFIFRVGFNGRANGSRSALSHEEPYPRRNLPGRELHDSGHAKHYVGVAGTASSQSLYCGGVPVGQAAGIVAQGSAAHILSW